MRHLPRRVRLVFLHLHASLGAVAAGSILARGSTNNRGGKLCTPHGIGMGGRCMLVPAAPVRLVRARMIVTIVEAPTQEPCVPGTTDSIMVTRGCALYRRGGGGNHGPCACDI